MIKEFSWWREVQAGSAALFAPTVVFILVPSGIILRNLDEVPYDRSLVLGFLLAFTFSSILSALMFVSAHRFKLLALPARVSIVGGVAVLFWDVSGALLDSRSIALSGMIELLAVLIVSIFVFRSAFDRLLVVFSVIAPVILLSGLWEHYVKTADMPEEWSPSWRAGSSPPVGAAQRITLSADDLPLSYLRGQEKVEIESALAFDKAVSAPGVDVDWTPHLEIITSDKKNDRALMLPFTDPPPIEVAAFLHIRFQVLQGRIKFGILSENRREWLPGTLKLVDQGNSPTDAFIKIPFSAALGPLVISNYAKGIRSIVRILDLELYQVDLPNVPKSFAGNVYHILLDSYQREAYQYLAQSKPESSSLPMTFYPSFRSNSGRTWTSVSELFSGSFYNGTITPDEWRKESIREGFIRYLVSFGVQVHQYPHYLGYCHPKASICKTNLELKKDLLNLRSTRSIIDLWFLKLLPSTAGRRLNAESLQEHHESGPGKGWDYGFSIVEALMGTDQRPTDADNPYFSVKHFEEFLDDEAARPDTGQYVFVHSIIPHDPLVLDGECAYVGVRRPQKIPEHYLEQAQCARKLIGMLLSKLEDLGRLETSLVIVHSDHGFYWHPRAMGFLEELNALDKDAPWTDVDTGDSAAWPSEMIETRSSALLLTSGLHPPAAGPSTADQRVEMIDIAPTILRFLDIDTATFSGVPIQVMTRSQPRSRFFYATGKPYPVFSRYRFVDDRWVFDQDIKVASR